MAIFFAASSVDLTPFSCSSCCIATTSSSSNTISANDPSFKPVVICSLVVIFRLVKIVELGDEVSISSTVSLLIIGWPIESVLKSSVASLSNFVICAFACILSCNKVFFASSSPL